MVRLLSIFILIFLIGCGARTKNLQKTETTEQLSTTLKKDSVGIKKVEATQNIQENKIVENNTVYDSEGEDVEFTLIPRTDIPKDTVVTTATVKLKTPKGDYEYEIPTNYDFQFKTKSTKEAKTENSKETSQKQEVAETKSNEKANVSHETSNSQRKSENNKNLNVETKEPIWFNLGFWGLIAAIIIAAIIYLKINKII